MGAKIFIHGIVVWFKHRINLQWELFKVKSFCGHVNV